MSNVVQFKQKPPPSKQFSLEHLSEKYLTALAVLQNISTQTSARRARRMAAAALFVLEHEE